MIEIMIMIITIIMVVFMNVVMIMIEELSCLQIDLS